MKSLIAIDFINEIVDPNGRLAAKGYADFIEQHGTNGPLNQPKSSPVFGRAQPTTANGL